MKKGLPVKTLALGFVVLLMCISTMLLTGSLSVEKHILTKELICKSDSRDDNDTTPPVTTIYFDPSEPNGLNNWYVSNIEITLEAIDDLSGVDYIKYLLDDNDWMVYTSPLIIEFDGYHRITYYAVDKAGNVEEPNEVVRFKLDKTKPKISMNYTWIRKTWRWNFWYELIINATCTDAMSEMEHVDFYFNDVLQETIIGVGPDYVWGPFLPPPCDIHIKGIAYDRAGNNDYAEINNPKHRNNGQTLPNNANKLITTVIIKSGNFFLLRYFSSLPFHSLVQNIIFNIS